MDLPRDLEAVVLERFDELVHQKQLLWAPSDPEVFTDGDFDFELRISPILKEKPITSPHALGRSKAVGPFVDPDPSEVICTVGSSHRLMLNKFCVYRPMLLVTTIEFVQQSHDLDEADIASAWAVLNAMDTEQVVAYNCGINAGSSQGHKHMQLFPIPDEHTIFPLWPSRAKSVEEITTNIKNVPIQHLVLAIPPDSTADFVFGQHQRLLLQTKRILKEAGQVDDYNVVFTKEWIALIPRSRMDINGPFGANALGMLGLVSLRDEEERSRWIELGWVAHIKKLGIAKA